jgi:hypothetical protein
MLSILNTGGPAADLTPSAGPLDGLLYLLVTAAAFNAG